MVYLIKDGDTVQHYYDEASMQAAGHKKADKIVTEYDFNSNGCYARLIEGEIVVGKTPEEKGEEEAQTQINNYKQQLAQIDQDAMTGRAVRELVLELAERAGIQSDAVEILQNYETRAEPIRDLLSPLLI
jgi:hypothetical protein